jgi:hypothetical protein
VHELLGFIRGGSVNHISNIVFVHAFDLHARRRHVHTGEVDDIVIITVFLRVTG